VNWALAAETPLTVEGTGTRTALGRPCAAEQVLSLAAMTGITLYEPGELVLSAQAGTPLEDIRRALAGNHQQMAFEPVDTGPLLGKPVGGGTLGGMVASALSGPRRIKAGALRDHVLGFTAVTGRGEQVKSGGRVMKNVTGYDLSKLLTGSWGTLAAMAEITLKVLPAPECEQTLLIHGLDDAAAISFLTRATGTALDGSGFAHLPDEATGSGVSLTAIRFEGPEISVRHRLDAMKKLAGAGHHTEALEARSPQFWQVLRDGLPLAALDGQIWRISTAPAAGPGIITALGQAGVPLLSHFYDWAGGLVWLAVAAAPDAHASAIRTAVNRAGGHAMLLRAEPQVRRTAPAFHPEPAPLAALAKRVKESFDPQGILNPGRMWEGA